MTSKIKKIDLFSKIKQEMDENLTDEEKIILIKMFNEEYKVPLRKEKLNKLKKLNK
jgi:hypothetical protein